MSPDIAVDLVVEALQIEVLSAGELEPRKLAKQMQYADRAGIRFVVIRGEDEAAKGVVAVKDLRRGEQFEVADDDLSRTLLVEREQARSMP